MDVIVYSSRGCQACALTVKALTAQGVTVETVYVEDSPRAAELVRAMGFTQAPVVFTGSDWWSGFRLDRIKALRAA